MKKIDFLTRIKPVIYISLHLIYLKKMFLKKIGLPLFLFILLVIQGQSAFGQCSSCSVVVDGNSAPSASIVNNSTVCIQGNRTATLNFGNSTGINICIQDGASWNGDHSNLNNLATLTNFGNLSLSNAPSGNWTITNYGEAELSISLAANRSLVNYGQITISTPTFAVSSNSSLVNYGRITVSTSTFTIFSSSTFLSNGFLDISGSINFNSNSSGSLVGSTTIGGAVTVNPNANINLGGSLVISGNLSLSNNSSIQGVNTNSCNSISVAGTFVNNGVISGGSLQSPDSRLFVNKGPTGNPISNGASVGSCPTSNCMQSFQLTTVNGFDWVYVFDCTSNFVLPPLLPGEELIDISVAVVGGGGAGGFGEAAGGGGAGAIFLRDGKSLTVGRTYTVAVGPGGVGATTATAIGGNGFTSAFFGSVAPGGGGGGSQSSGARSGNAGGSGGGGGAHGPSSGAGNGGANMGTLTNRGGNGRRQNANQFTGGGGGGASLPGQDADVNNPGNGGSGTTLPIINGITGITNAFAGGGGGTGRNPSQRWDGAGGVVGSILLGGFGRASGIGESGRSLTGSGGGAGSVRGGAGSGGRVIVRASYRILPIEVLEIKGQFFQESRTAKLDWAVYGFQDNLLMTVQRAVNTVENWVEIDTVRGEFLKPELKSFIYEDQRLPVFGGTLFYRIKLSHPDGSVLGYSNVVALEIQAKQGIPQWIAFPNPSGKSKMKLSYTGDSKENNSPILAILSDFSGKSVQKESFSIDEIADWLNSQMEKTGNGIFILKIGQGTSQEVIKLLNY
jgi:hypothetical protein